MGWFARLLGRGDAELPDRPSSGNGSSAWHLWWHGVDGGAVPVVAASVTLEVLQLPAVDRLYFWALQASFTDGVRTYGTAHTGLQWNPRHPGNRAVNWGGYGDVGDVQSVLPGSASPLPSAPDDPNTRDYPWQEAWPYRLRICRGERGWRAEITDLVGGAIVAIRELHAGGDRLAGLVMWSEVFCSCHDPTTVVRWSDMAAERADGSLVHPPSVGLTFPREGCPNTDSVADGGGLLQVSHTPRRARDGESVAVPGPEA
jgi:hypothetical protein